MLSHPVFTLQLHEASEGGEASDAGSGALAMTIGSVVAGRSRWAEGDVISTAVWRKQVTLPLLITERYITDRHAIQRPNGGP